MLMFVVLLVGVLGALVHVLHKYNYVRQLWLTADIPGPKAYPVIGNGYAFINASSTDNFVTITQWVRDYGEIVRVWLGPDLNIFLSNPKDVEVILSSTKHTNKSTEYEFIRPWLNDGLLISAGKKWMQRRKILTPAFHFKILEQFVEIFDRQAGTAMQTLAQFDAADKVEMYPIATLYALDVICESAMGTRIDAQLNSHSEYVMAVKEMANIIHLRMFDIALRIDTVFNLSRLGKRMRRALKVLHGFTDNVIQERRAELLAASRHDAAVAGDCDDIGTKRKSAFLDILLQARIDDEPLSDLDIREEVDTFMFEGHDTTTSGITFCMYTIAKHPDVQRKCFEEIRRVIGTNKDAPVTLQSLQNLSYLDAVIKETLRLYPSVPLIGREITEETTINGRVFPAKCNIIVPIYNMGRNASLFAQPDEFRPERFVGEESSNAKFDTFAYVPFSAGSRNCIGQKFAMLELKSIVSKMLRHFEIALAADSVTEPELKADLIMTPATRIDFHLKPRIY